MSDASGPVGRRIDAEELLAHAAWLRALARSLVRDEHAADDVVQETFAAAVARPPREPGALRGWLARVARNAAFKSIRGDRRRAAREDAAPRRAPELASDELVARIELQRALLDAVQELEPPYRTVVMMRFYDGKEPREIARELGVTSEVVWQRLSRATSMLRARLDRDNGGREKWAGVLLLWLDGRALAKAGAGAGAAAAAGTGVAIVGTKMVLAGVAAAALGAWLLWPRAEEAQHTAANSADATKAAVPAMAPVAPRPRRDADAATDTAPAVAAQVPRATTRGRVIDAATGEPIAGARVKVIRKSAGGGFQWSLVTGADGRFVGEATETARYSNELEWSAVHSDVFVEASARGYIWFYEGPWTGSKGEDLGDVKLFRGVIVRGRVVHDDGRTVPGAHVYATASPAQVGQDLPLNRARSLGEADGDGRFELDEALPPTTGGGVFTLFAACPAGAAFTTLAVRPGRDVIDDVVLTLHVAGVTIRVFDPDGRPVEGCMVTALPRFGGLHTGRLNEKQEYPIGGDDALRGVFAKMTGADGVATFDGLPIQGSASLYAFAATAPGFVKGSTDDTAVGSPRDASVEIRLEQEHAYLVGARVVDPDGRPVEGATVTVDHGPKSNSVATGADGTFVLLRGKGEPRGLHASVTITKDGFAACRTSVYRWPDDGRATTDIKLERPSAVSGTIVDQDGKPVAGAMFWLWRPDAYVKAPGDGKTGADGRFELPDATPGRWALSVTPPFDRRARWVVPAWSVVEGGQGDVVVRLERLPEGRAKLVCTIVDGETGKEADADVAMLVAAEARGSTQIMGALPQSKIEHGRVTFTDVAPGAYALWLRVADRPHQLVRIRVADGEIDVRATCRVRRGVTITGRVRLPDGVAGTSVGLECALTDGLLSAGGPGWGAMTAAGSAKVAADGTFRIEGMTPAVYRLDATAGTWMGDAVVDASQGDAVVDVELQRAASVRVSVPASPGYECVRVDVSHDGGAWTRLVTAGRAQMPQGVSVKQTLRPGRLRWRATFRATLNSFDPLDTAEPQEGEVSLEAGKETEIAVPVVPLR